ncbi:MAG: hypothetical protein AAGE84_01945 [Cyanobacteria bacterium P01_G01_bin.39]
MEKIYLTSGLTAPVCSLVYLVEFPLAANAQPAPEELPPRETLQQTIPRNTQPVP